MSGVAEVIVAAVMGGGALVAWLVDAWGKREPAPSPVARIADLKAGQRVRVIGKVVDGSGLVAPISGRACACFDAAVIAYVERSDPSDPSPIPRKIRVTTILDRRLHGAPFVIDDGTGRATVDPRGAFVHLRTDLETSALDRLTGADPGFVAVAAGFDQVEVEERVLTIGEEVVVDALVQLDGVDGLYREAADTRVYLVGAPDRPAIVSERPADLAKARPRAG